MDVICIIDPRLQRTHTHTHTIGNRNIRKKMTIAKTLKTHAYHLFFTLGLTVTVLSPHLLFFINLSLQLLHSDAQLGVFLLLLIRFVTLSFQFCDLNTHTLMLDIHFV